MGSVPHPSVRDRLAKLAPDQRAAATAEDADGAIAAAARVQPDVALVDVRMPGGGASAARGIKECSPHTGVLAFSASGYTSTYLHFPMNDAARAVLKPNSNNTLAVHCRQTGGGQYVDVGLDVRSDVFGLGAMLSRFGSSGWSP